ncbi:hypothetical protein DQ384_29830 [Sphaerisporangium album]|uniref:Uncharacterized protein n=1 Tax=Sphaerisporangium album TaxID=509200 RepID=A0A367F738_9ACTN|nr:hypothetical protein DQ384_29830 [Sphaerisporangium album]
MTLMVCAAAAAACASSPASPDTSAPAGSTTGKPAASARSHVPVSGETRQGCGDTPVRDGSPPAWASVNAPGTRFVLGREGNALGYLFTQPLRAGHPADPANKILWYVRQPREAKPLRVLAHPRGREHPVVELRFPSDSGPGEIYPSITDLPRPGCWTLELTWGSHHDTVDLFYRR